MDLNQESEIELLKVCRSCLNDDSEMKTIFITENTTDESISKKLECISAIEINESDGFPALICQSCEQRLNNAYEFRLQCQRSYSTLKQYIQNALVSNLKDDILLEENNILEDAYNMKEECEAAIADTVESSDYDDDELDNKPLIDRKEDSKHKGMTQYDAELVNKAIVASRKKHNEKRECRLCGFISSNARGLSLHIGHVHKELKERWCNVCYQEVDDLPTHMKEHAKVKPYICTFCNKGFSSQGHLTEHFRSHSVERPYKCKECGKGFLSARHLRVHDRIHSGEKPYECPYCRRQFTQNGTLQGHIRRHTGSKPFHCEVCEKKFTTSSALAFHRTKAGHLLPKTDNEQSQTTDQELVNEQTMDNVIVTYENEIIKDEDKKELFGEENDSKKLCTVCGKTFGSVSKLRLHMRVHTGETPYKCSYCNKRFTTRGQLVVHERTHTGEKPHVCHVCGKGFAQSSVLNTHMKLHTGRPEVCQICEQRFCRPAELRLHMRKHTGEKPYLCTVCGQAFIQRSHLMEHVKIHSDERPYKCTLCDRAFKQSSSLKSHVQIHTGHKPYQCSQCPYACRQSYALTQHMRQHQGDPPLPHRPHECVVCHKSFTTMAMLNSHSRTVHNAIF